MARRVLCLRDWDYRAKPGVVIAYKAGWSGRLLDAAWRKAPVGVFQEVEGDGQTGNP